VRWLKLQEWTLTEEIAGVDNAGVDNDEVEEVDNDGLTGF